MKVLIIEDEVPAAEKLQRYLAKYDPGIDVVAHLTTVKDSVIWLQDKQDTIDLVDQYLDLTRQKADILF